MKRRILPSALAMLTIFAVGCGDDGGGEGYDDPYGDQANVNVGDGGAQLPGLIDAGRSGDAGALNPWGVQDAQAINPNGWDASAPIDAALSGPSDAGAWSDAARLDAASGGDAAAGDAGAPVADAGGAGCATLTYQSFGQKFMSDYCVSCHGAVNPRNNVRLDSLAQIATRKAQVKSAVSSGAMPQGTKKPSGAERTQLGQWLDCGPK
jgi:hypothetical protein